MNTRLRQIHSPSASLDKVFDKVFHKGRPAFLFHAGAQSGFTLIELVVSSGLMALILISGYLCLSSGMATQKLVESRGETLQGARVQF